MKKINSTIFLMVMFATLTFSQKLSQTVRGTILDAHRKKTDKKIDFAKARELMEREIASDTVKEMQ